MTTNSEQVQYQLEVVTKGREELEKFHNSFGKLEKQNKKNVKANKEQNTSGELLTRRMKNQISPLRDLVSGFQKLNPSVLLSSLGITGLVATLNSLTNAYHKQISSGTSLAALINQYTTETISYRAILEKTTQLAETYGLKIEDVEASFSSLIPITRDYSLAQDILVKSILASERADVDLLTVVRQMASVYKDGAFFMDDFGGSMLFGVEAVDALAAAFMEAGDDEIESLVNVENEFDAWIEGLKRKMNEYGAEFAINFKEGFLQLMKGEFEGILSDILNPSEWMDSGGWLVLSDFGKRIWDSIKEGWSDSVSTSWLWDLIKGDWSVSESVNWIVDQLKSIWNSTIGALVNSSWLWDLIKGDWIISESVDYIVSQLKSIWNSTIGTLISGSWLWDSIKGDWNTSESVDWVSSKLKEIFSGVEDVISSTFTSAGDWIWDTIKSSWNLVDKGIEFLGDVFDDSENIISSAFKSSGSWIWDTIKSSWNLIDKSIDWIGDAFDTVSSVIGERFKDSGSWMWDTIKNSWSLVDKGLDFIGNAFDPLKNTLYDKFKTSGNWMWGNIQSSWYEVDKGLDFIGNAFNSLKDILYSKFKASGNLMWGKIKSSWYEVDKNLDFIGNAFNSVKNVIIDKFKDAGSWIWNTIKSGVDKVFGTNSDEGKPPPITLGPPVIDEPHPGTGGGGRPSPPPSGGGDWDQDWYDSDAPSGDDDPFPGSLPGFFPDSPSTLDDPQDLFPPGGGQSPSLLPGAYANRPAGIGYFGDGGIAWKPQLAMLAEKGPERITPLDQERPIQLQVFMDGRMIGEATTSRLNHKIRLRGAR